MSLSTILQKIDAEAEIHSHKLLEQARAEAANILAQGRAEAEQEAAQILQQAETDLQNFYRKQRATTVLQVRKQNLDRRQQALDEVFTTALTRICACPPDQYLIILTHILAGIPEELPGKIRVAEADQGLVTAQFIDTLNRDLAQQQRMLRFELATEPAAIPKGCLVDFGDFELNFSFKILLADVWDGLKRDVSAQLFGETSNG